MIQSNEYLSTIFPSWISASPLKFIAQKIFFGEAVKIFSQISLYRVISLLYAWFGRNAIRSLIVLIPKLSNCFFALCLTSNFLMNEVTSASCLDPHSGFSQRISTPSRTSGAPQTGQSEGGMISTAFAGLSITLMIVGMISPCLETSTLLPYFTPIFSMKSRLFSVARLTDVPAISTVSRIATGDRRPFFDGSPHCTSITVVSAVDSLTLKATCPSGIRTFSFR